MLALNAFPLVLLGCHRVGVKVSPEKSMTRNVSIKPRLLENTLQMHLYAFLILFEVLLFGLFLRL